MPWWILVANKLSPKMSKVLTFVYINKSYIFLQYWRSGLETKLTLELWTLVWTPRDWILYISIIVCFTLNVSLLFITSTQTIVYCLHMIILDIISDTFAAGGQRFHQFGHTLDGTIGSRAIYYMMLSHVILSNSGIRMWLSIKGHTPTHSCPNRWMSTIYGNTQQVEMWRLR